VWDKEVVWGTPSKCKTTVRYRKQLAVMVLVQQKQGIKQQNIIPPILGKGGRSELMQMADKRNGKTVTQSVLVEMLRFKQQD
jgi:hypothetical protein